MEQTAETSADILRALAKSGAKVVVIGGIALQMQGSAYTTYDLDIAYERSRENAAVLCAALRRFAPRPRGWRRDLPFVFDAQTVLTSEILTLETTAGDLDLLAVVKGLGSFADVDRLADTKTFEKFELRVLSVEGLIAAKRAAGRPKDEPGLIELEAIREARNRLDRGSL